MIGVRPATSTEYAPGGEGNGAAPAAELSPLQRALLALRKARTVIDDLERAKVEPIAIVGMACRFPGGASSPEAFFRLLEDGVDAVTEVPGDRFAPGIPGRDPADPAARATRWGAFLKEDLRLFDAAFFGISPREASAMDPQQRLLLEVAWEALERAGQAADRLAGSRAGVFLGIMSTDYAELSLTADPVGQDLYLATGNGHCFPAGRLSYTLGFMGPSLVVDTACSSSLVAVHLACRSLRSGESSLALAGGVSLMLSPSSARATAKLGALAPDGRCRSFDAGASGYVRGEGCGIVVLKRLSDAVRDGDPIQAVIRGSAVNQDGRSTGLTTPNVLSQQALLRQALEDARVAPEDVGYVETHGTGTPLGDPIEIEALRAVLGKPRADGSRCMLGALKTNIGHLEAAAGVAGLIKAVLCLQRAAIPPNLHFEALNPRISLDGTPFSIPTGREAWPGAKPRVAGVSSFGLSGTNAHVVLEEAPRGEGEPVEAIEAAEASSALLPMSARSPEALDALAQAYRDLLLSDGARLHDVAFTASTRRSHLEHRLAVVGSSSEEMAAALASCLRGEAPAGVARGRASGLPPKVVFVFPGQGSQWAGMGRQLFAEEPAFRQTIEACDQAIRREAGFSVIEVLAAEDSARRLEAIDVVQPVLFAIEVALAALWRAWGVEPDAVVGHSMGEVAAAHVAGALSLEDAAAVICRRSRLLRRVSGQGAMAMCELSMEEAEAELRGYEDRLSIAVSNGPRSTVIAGEPAAMDQIVERLERRGLFCRRIKVDVASHSPQMDPLREELVAALRQVAPRAASLPMRSTVTGAPARGDELGASYWADNLRRPVLFARVIRDLVDAGHALFLEMSPHPILTPSVEEHLHGSGRQGAAIASLRRESDARRCLLEALAALYAHGYAVPWKTLAPQVSRTVLLPTYPWQREPYWLDAPAAPVTRLRQAAARGGRTHPLLGASTSLSALPGAHLWEQALRREAPGYLEEHRVLDEVVLPAAAYLEMALAAGAALFRGETGGEPPSWIGATVSIEAMVVERMLVLPEGGEPIVQTVLTDEGAGVASFQIASQAGAGRPWQTHATGRVRRASDRGAPEHTGEAIDELKRRLSPGLPRASYYRRAEAAGIQYGPAFQGVLELWAGDGEVLGRVRLPDDLDDAGYSAHPALLDACFQVLGGLFSGAGTSASEAYVPVGIGRCRFIRRPGREAWVAGALRAAPEAGPDERVFDLWIRDEAGRVIAEITGFRVRRLPAPTRADALEGCVLELAWRRVDPLPAVDLPGAGAWLLLADRSGVGAALRARLTAGGRRCVTAFAGSSYRKIEPDLYEIDPSSRGDLSRLLRDAFGEAERCLGAVHLFSLDAAPFEQATPESVQRDLARGAVSAAYLAQALVQAGPEGAPRLFLVTRGAQAVAADDLASVSQAPIWGLGRTLALEHPELGCTRVDLDPRRDDGEALLLLRELAAGGREDQIALRSSARHVARIVRGRFEPDEGLEAEPRLEPADGRAFRLEAPSPGVLERLALHVMRRRPPGPGEVEIEVEAAGLNFLDVLKAMGTCPGVPPGAVPLGGECAGRVTAVGDGVAGLEIGQEVVAVAPAAFASHATTPAPYVAPKPAGLSFAQAATLPVVFMTAWYALHHVGRARRGESILIHAGAGGTGLAAIQIARMLGLRIFATAGSEEKRAYLRDLGLEGVMDSRSLAFADEILAATGGRGVDLVLNSLSGEALVKSLEVLAPYGRFLEIGKRDIYDNTRIGLVPFRKSLSYSAIDLAGMSAERPELFASLLVEVMEHVEAGRFAPLPVRVFAASEAEDAFRFMAQARHVGKIALAMTDPDARVVPEGPAGAELRPAEQKRSRAIGVRPDGSYLITGGLGGLGLSLAQWLIDRGARHLALVGRGAPREEARAALGAMEAAGARVECLQADVSRREEVERILSIIEARMPPLRGVVHAAAVLDDHTLLELSEESFRKVFAPKALGALHLHALTAGKDLDFFVLYSSAASLFGSPAQGNYTAANAFLDALSRWRARMGLPAMSVQWGAFSEVGLAAAQENRGARLEQRGARSLSPAEGLAALARLFDHPRPEVGIARIDVRQWTELFPRLAGTPFLCELDEGAPDRSEGGAGLLRQQLAGAAAGERMRLLVEHLTEQLSRVLRMDPARIAPRSPLRDLGVDSLMSLELRNRLTSSLGIPIGATVLLTHPDLASVAEHVASRLGLEVGDGPMPPLAAAPPADAQPDERAGIPLSHGQRALWFLYRIAPESAAYIVGTAVRVRSRIDVDALRRAVAHVVRRHPVLRTTYAARDGEVVQHVDERGEALFEVMDASAWRDEELTGRVGAFANRTIDLERGPVMRVQIFSRAPSDHVLLVTTHHIAMDLWSLSILLEELSTLYVAYEAGARVDLPPVQHSYADFVRWQQAMLESAEGERLFAYWKEELRGELSPLELPADRPRPRSQTYRGTSRSFVVPPALGVRLKELCRVEGTTVFTVLLSAFQVLLHRWSGQDDILVGSPAAGRSQEAFQSVVGYFVNPVVLRADFSDDPDFRTALARTHRKVLGAIEHQDYPFSLLVERLGVPRDPSRSPVFQAMFVLERSHRSEDVAALVVGEEGANLTFGTLQGTSMTLPDRGAQVDLSLMMAEAAGRFSGSFHYNTDLFDDDTLARMEGHFLTLLESIARAPEQRVSELPLLGADERERLLVSWNDTRASYREGACVHEIVEAWAERTPDATAVVFEEERLSYRALNARANRLARRLRAAGVKPDTVVGLCMDRSPEMLVAMVGILKAGGAYLPMDPGYPAERLRFMLADAQVRAIVTRAACVGALPPHPARRFVIDEDLEATSLHEDANPAPSARPDHLAYVIYTSGSTGIPKGVACHHAGVLNLIDHFQRLQALMPGDTSSFWSSQCFDASVYEIFSALLTGGAIDIPPDDVRVRADAFIAWLGERKIRGAYIPPFMVDHLHDALAAGGGPTSLRRIMVGVEPLSERTLARIAASVPGLRVINAYGPTETTVCAALYPIDPEVAPDQRAPIGRPVQNMQCYVLGRGLQPVPTGVPGELYVGGLGVTRGYLNRPDLTAERFLPDPFSSTPGARMYRTGDKVRWRADGNLEFQGRLDHQVKIRGHRIELGEIESVLQRHPAVREAAVLAREDRPGDKRLVAYVVLRDPSGSCTASDLRKPLQLELPDYMVPSTFVWLDAMPLTSSDKIDRLSLPPPPRTRGERDGALAEPRDALELDLVRIWEEVLAVSPVGIHDDFFSLGGHSLLAVSLMRRVEQRCGRKLPIDVLFRAPTAGSMAALLRDKAEPEPWSPLVAIQPAQRGRPFFCVHGLVGTVMVFVPLARYMGKDRPFYGLQAQGLLDDQPPCDDIEAMATRYIEAIRAVQPEGPYQLGGFSFGGLVAIEMARQLREAGQEIALLAVLDTAPPDFMKRSAPEDGPAALIEMAKGLGVDFSLDELNALPPEQRLAYAHDRILAVGVLPPELSPERLMAHIDAHVSAGRAYAPRIPCRMTFFRALDAGWYTSGSGLLPDFRDEWSACSPHPVISHDVPGTHFSMIFEPHVRTLAERLRACLDEVDPP
ncbi:amino acid adenylation domain-containing protein [Sorangium sp. So ce233]|uniref:amino acid adenylation domain-containing protein n=1 Tax=Sorangium sp. So ce233 TaxID=3133290 RepID=UPI003F6056F4